MNSRTHIGDLSFTWAANKNKISESITGVMSGYGFTSGGTTYDFEDCLTDYARVSRIYNQSWNLTSVGDWTSVTTNGIAHRHQWDSGCELLCELHRRTSRPQRRNEHQHGAFLSPKPTILRHRYKSVDEQADRAVPRIVFKSCCCK